MRILEITNDLLSERMASPAIRCWEIAAVIGEKYETTLTSSNKTVMQHNNFEVKSFRGNPDTLMKIASDHDVIIIHPYTLTLYPGLKDLDKILIMDLYAPFILEKLEASTTDKLDEKLYNHDRELSSMIEQIMACDYFLCASGIQKRFWTGLLSPLFVPEKSPYNIHEELTKRIIVIPFGIPEKKPVLKKRILLDKGLKNKNDFLLIWGGGIWNWFDTRIIIEGMKILAKSNPEIKLFFMSARHPHPAMPESQHRLLNETIREAEKAGLINKTIFFNDKWIPYDERCNYLLDADAGLSTHHNHLETRYAFRTRILDYIWCNLPIICTQGDYFAKHIEEHELGITIPEHKTESFTKAVIEMSDNPDLLSKFKKNMESLAPEFKWSLMVEPLIKILENPSSIPFSPGNRESLSKYLFLNPLHDNPAPKTDRIKRTFYFLWHEGFSSIKRKLSKRD